MFLSILGPFYMHVHSQYYRWKLLSDYGQQGLISVA